MRCPNCNPYYCGYAAAIVGLLMGIIGFIVLLVTVLIAKYNNDHYKRKTPENMTTDGKLRSLMYFLYYPSFQLFPICFKEMIVKYNELAGAVALGLVECIIDIIINLLLLIGIWKVIC